MGFEEAVVASLLPTAAHDRVADGICVACARPRAREPPYARANASSLHEDRGDMRRALGRGRIEMQHTWLTQLSWRSRWLTPEASAAASENGARVHINLLDW